MDHSATRTAAAWLLAAMWLASPVPAEGGSEHGTETKDAVVLLHGLGRTNRSMEWLAAQLREAGFEPHNFDYPSRQHPPEELLAKLAPRIEACCAAAPSTHFVTHSLGGILTRAYLAGEPAVRPGRVVMLAPPNRGSEIVDTYGDWAIFERAMGPTAVQLGTAPDSLPNRLPPPDVEVGVIAGTGTINPLGSIVIPDEDDGMVSVQSTRLEGMKDFLVVEDNHALIMRSEEVASQVIHFLRHGRFRRPSAPNPE